MVVYLLMVLEFGIDSALGIVEWRGSGSGTSTVPGCRTNAEPQCHQKVKKRIGVVFPGESIKSTTSGNGLGLERGFPAPQIRFSKRSTGGWVGWPGAALLLYGQGR